jgi:hypothetical protein
MMCRRLECREDGSRADLDIRRREVRVRVAKIYICIRVRVWVTDQWTKWIKNIDETLQTGE